VTCFELPVYHPSPAEKADPKLYAANVRKLMVSGAAHFSRGAGSGSAGAVCRMAVAPSCCIAAAVVTWLLSGALQMDFAGLQPTHATYHDKMALMKRLRQEHGMDS